MKKYSQREEDLKKLLDIVAIGTICDVVPLKTINRLLVKKGLEVININPNNGESLNKNNNIILELIVKRNLIKKFPNAEIIPSAKRRLKALESIKL